MGSVEESLHRVLVNDNWSAEVVLLFVKYSKGQQQVGDMLIKRTQHCLRVLLHSGIDNFGVFDVVYVQERIQHNFHFVFHLPIVYVLFEHNNHLFYSRSNADLVNAKLALWGERK